MRNVIGVFETGAAARSAVRQLHAAGFGEDDIAFVLDTTRDERRESGAVRDEATGRRVGELMADVGESALSFVPFVGRNLIHSPMGQALRDAVQTTSATAGKLLGAMADGGFSAEQRDTLSGMGGAATVTVRTTPDQAGKVVDILTQSGAIQVMSSRDIEPRPAV